MLELKNITKVYTAGEDVHALKDVSIKFWESEFVSILGPSGCGKTTLLNIIGGLDNYTKGDLIINGKSTKEFKDRDWDAYRNHSIGFVFQGYNLIPHQTVLQNVEIALTLSGASKSYRRKRAIEALKEVGLEDQIHKKPSEMSGGQMQRVAIARAIVNDPDIILADEPTGALDTKTSVQVMDILKEISKKRLVIMVTHNPDLANKYSTRIINILDGEITADYRTGDEVLAEKDDKKDQEDNETLENKKNKRPSMNFATAFILSLKNLLTKKGRTALVSFAGSIGIIGIALVFAVSQGTTDYIDAIQEETLSAYPLTLEAQHTDISTLIEKFMGQAESEQEHTNDAVYQKSMLSDMVNAINSAEDKENDLKSFKAYLEKERADENSPTGLSNAISAVSYTYDTDMIIYTKSPDGQIIHSDATTIMQDIMFEYMGMDSATISSMSNSAASNSPAQEIMSTGTSIWQEILVANDGELINPILKKQYDVVYGSWPSKYDEVVIVLDENNEINDLTLYALGLKSKDEIDKIVKAAKDKTTVDNESKSWSYEEICSMEYRTVLKSDCFKYNDSTGEYTDLRDTQTGMKYLYDNGLSLKVSGIIKPNENTSSAMLKGSIGYTNELTKYIINKAKESDVVKEQLENNSVDVITGLPFKETGENLDNSQKTAEFKNYINSLGNEDKAKKYIQIMSIPSDQEVDAFVNQTIQSSTTEDLKQQLKSALS
ncbi:MAG: ABC transporter ATP-binding protein, partial [Clostridia bacterium]|nr:ABC transporter ATP-binding protein [Clostridia bacterium]